MSERYVIVREDGKALCRRANPPGTMWCEGEGPGIEMIRLTKEGAECMALVVGGTPRKVASSYNTERLNLT